MHHSLSPLTAGFAKFGVGLTLITACSSSASIWSGKYQNEERGIRVEFIGDNSAIVKTAGSSLELTYTIMDGEEEENWMLGGAIDAPIIQMQKQDDGIMFIINDDSVLLTQVNEFTILTPDPSEIVDPKQVEAKTFVQALNRAQKAFYEQMGQFSEDFDSLGTGISPETENYSYTLQTLEAGKLAAVNVATPIPSNINGYIGIVSIDKTKQVRSILCQANNNSTPIASIAQAKIAEIRTNPSAASVCPEGMTELE